MSSLLVDERSILELTSGHQGGLYSDLFQSRKAYKVMAKLISKTLFALGGFSMVACGVNDMAQKAADNTDSMNNQMGTMTDNTTDMKTGMDAMGSDMNDLSSDMSEMQKTIDTLKKQVDELGSDARQGVGAGLRDTAWEAVSKAKYIESKFAQTAIYFASFEFQTWKGTGLDTKTRRESLEFDGVSEFLRTVAGIAQLKNFSLNVLSKDNDMNTLYAISALLHFVNPNQEIFAKSNNFEPRSMLNVIQNGIENQVKLRRAIKSGNNTLNIEMSKTDQEIQVWWDTSIYLMRLRGNFLSAIVVSKLAKLDLASNLIDERAHQLRLGVAKWQPKLDYYSSLPGAVLEITTYLKEAVRNKKFLISQDIEAKTDPILRKAISNLSIDETSAKHFARSLDGEGAISTEFLKALSELKSNY